MGCWPGHHHDGAPLPASGAIGVGVLGFGGLILWHTLEHPLSVRVRVRGVAQSMFSSASAFNQPLDAWDVGQLTTMAVRRRPGHGSWRGWGGGREAVLCHRSTHTRRACAVMLRSLCSSPRVLSTSPWLRGTLARSPTHWCATTHLRSQRGWGGWLRGVHTHSVCVHSGCLTTRTR